MVSLLSAMAMLWLWLVTGVDLDKLRVKGRVLSLAKVFVK